MLKYLLQCFTGSLLHWRDIVQCKYEESREEWHVIYEASPSLIAPYYRYEAVVDAKNGEIKSIKRQEK